MNWPLAHVDKRSKEHYLSSNTRFDLQAVVFENNTATYFVNCLGSASVCGRCLAKLICQSDRGEKSIVVWWTMKASHTSSFHTDFMSGDRFYTYPQLVKRAYPQLQFPIKHNVRLCLVNAVKKNQFQNFAVFYPQVTSEGFSCIVPFDISPMGNSSTFLQRSPAATDLRYPVFDACRVFWCFHNSPNSDMDNMIFNVHVWPFCKHISTETSDYSLTRRTL